MQSHISYIICSIERTGSYLLSDALGRTGIAGRPQEFFHPGYLAKLPKEAGEAAYAGYFAQIMAAGTTSNAVFGAKMHWSHMRDLLHRLRKLPDYGGMPIPELLPSVFPNLRYFQITRRDKLRQAISFLKARQTDIWWEMDAWMRHNRKTPAQAPGFDAIALDRLIHQIEAHEAAWEKYFKECGVQPFEVVYEDLVHSHAQYEQIIHQILHYLDIPLPQDLVIPAPRYKKQADAASEEWVKQYLQLKRARHVQPQSKTLTDETGQSESEVQSILQSQPLDRRAGDFSSSHADLAKVTHAGVTQRVLPATSILPPGTVSLRPLNIVTYASRPLGGAPLRLARCIDACTSHTARCVWPHHASNYSTDYRDTPAMAEAQLAAAEVVIVFDGNVAPQHRNLLSHKELITFAYSDFGGNDTPSEKRGGNEAANLIGLDLSWVRKGLPGVVLGQIAMHPYFQSALQNRGHEAINRADVIGRIKTTVWTVVPDPLPLWVEAYKPASKADVLTICYISPSLFSSLSTTSTKHTGTSAPVSAHLFEQSDDGIMLRTLEHLSRQYPIHVVVFGLAASILSRGKSVIAPTSVSLAPSSPSERRALRRQTHIILEDCASSNYHHASLAGLATGGVVVNGVGQQPQVVELFRACAYGRSTSDCCQDDGFIGDGIGLVDKVTPFVYADVASLESVLSNLICSGVSSLEEAGRDNRRWVEKHWDFTSQWEQFWEPLIKRVVPPSVPGGKIVLSNSALSIAKANSQVLTGDLGSVSDARISTGPAVDTAMRPARQREIDEQEVKQGTPSTSLPEEPASAVRLSNDKALSNLTATISVVIISHNEGEYLQRTIKSLQAGLSGGSEIIVVDDHSTDGSTEGLNRSEGRISVLRPSNRLGVAAARNFGATHAKGDIIVFSDAHVSAPSNWVTPLADALARREVGAVAPAVSVMGRLGVKGYGGFVRAEELSWRWLGWQGRNLHQVPLLCGCFLAIRRDVLEATGGFDSGMITYGLEDIEFSLRLWLLGYECMVAPAVEVAHRFRPRDESIPDYQRDWLPVIHNMLRLAVIHYGGDRVRRLVERRAKNNAFPLAFARVVASDAWQRRSDMHAIRCYDDDWYFRKFDTVGKPR